ncbi:dihydrodipicolinate synthase family protein [Mycobacterium sp.]|uniref:dihydrodipicolinate synthase family protein n=1 Tax=Mycobacterium sp. TaxID=1785 RepID=UPI0031D194BB
MPVAPWLATPTFSPAEEPAVPAIHGIIAYPVTPFSADDDIDTAALTALVEALVGAGVHAIAPLGSTGELAYLDEAEFDTVVDTTIAAVGGRVPVVAGVSDLTTAATIRRARYAEKAGADAVMVLPVSYWKLAEREIVAHYRGIGESIGIPVMAYNNPATSGIDMRPELLVGMFETIDNLTMVKESTGDLSRMQRLAELSGGELPFYNGSNPLVLDALRAGAAGWCTAAPCLRPQPCIALYEAVHTGDLQTAQRLYDDLRPLLEFIVAGGLPTTVKAGLDLLGVPVGDPRRPLLPLDDDGRARLRELLAR